MEIQKDRRGLDRLRAERKESERGESTAAKQRGLWMKGTVWVLEKRERRRDEMVFPFSLGGDAADERKNRGHQPLTHVMAWEFWGAHVRSGSIRRFIAIGGGQGWSSFHEK